MVEDSVTDGKRIAQLLASELTGLDLGALAGVSVVEAAPEATPSAEGTDAFRLNSRGQTVAVVSMFPDHARVSPAGKISHPFRLAPSEAGEHPSLDISGGALVIRSGGAVKPAVDAIRLFLDRSADGTGGSGV